MVMSVVYRGRYGSGCVVMSVVYRAQGDRGVGLRSCL